ncbi:MAG: phytanoyl-CoA dioxygenase family protein [Verrucomicrobia subdivision 3 bacterium]|nr:phytanoyl-CoA dioxygenase family protein [Limisphaerales bacterium]
MATFKTTPDQTDLDGIERDLRFHPSPVTEPATLTREQVDHFNAAGYVRPITIFDDAEIAGHRAYFDRLLEQTLAAGGDSYSISTAHLKHARVYDLLTHPRIVACVRDLLGPNVIGWGSHFFCKLPGDGKRVAWHQDASYWPLTPSKAVTCWLAIDDADTENACMRFLARSHHDGHLTWRPSTPEEHNTLNQTVEDTAKYGTPIDNILRAGQCSLHTDLLLHGSEANQSTRRRCALTLRYTTPEVRAGMDWNGKGVVVSGEDAEGYWANPPRPDDE